MAQKTKKKPETPERETVTVSMEYCMPGSHPYSDEMEYQRGVRFYRSYTEQMKQAADQESEGHIVRTVLKDGDTILEDNRVLCRHQKPFN